jgi:sulfate adenylyltransferase subunit 1
VRVGDEVEVFPGNFRTRVAGIDIAGRSVESAFAPQSINLRLDDEFDIARGSVIGHAGTLPEARNQIEGELFWLDRRSASAGMRVLVKWGTATVQAIVQQVVGRRNLDTLEIDEAQTLQVNDIGHAIIKFAQPLPVESYRVNRRGGAFLIIDPHDGATLAAGISTN